MLRNPRAAAPIARYVEAWSSRRRKRAAEAVRLPVGVSSGLQSNSQVVTPYIGARGLRHGGGT
jgi:hypothetical protein